jgi:hypothetical protein
LDGFGILSDVKLIRYPDRFIEPKGAAMWTRVVRLLEEIEQQPRPEPPGRAPDLFTNLGAAA